MRLTTLNLCSSLLVATGIAFLCCGCIPAYQICRMNNSNGWKGLLILICLFILGYSGFLYYLTNSPVSSPINLGVSAILFGGSIFVVVVIRYSLQTIKKLHQIAMTERYNALHDSLTHLPNRKYCLEQLNQQISLQKPFSIITFDINNFKQINDAMGHYCGDELLYQLSFRLKNIITNDYFLSRMGGDEFVILCPDYTNAELRKIIKKINSLLDKPFTLHGNNITTSVSAGISIYPTNAYTAEKLLQHSDIAMYKAKSMGQDYMLYHPMMDDDAKERLAISNRLKPALTNKEFRLYYQPLITSTTLDIHGYEALIRWPQEDGSFIAPDIFIPIAEQSNLIKSITHWVLIQIVEDLKTFNQNGIKACIHMNLSAKDLSESDLLYHLTALLDSNRIEPHQLILEVTESAMLTDLNNTKLMLEQLRNLGFSISLDDFGTGFSSLSLLRELPIDQIKIDRSFIMEMNQNISDQAIVRSCIALAHGLGHTVVAEGVENMDTVELLQNMKCTYLQGYHFQRPQPLVGTIEWSNNRNNKSKNNNVHPILQIIS